VNIGGDRRLAYKAPELGIARTPEPTRVGTRSYDVVSGRQVSQTKTIDSCRVNFRYGFPVHEEPADRIGANTITPTSSEKSKLLSELQQNAPVVKIDNGEDEQMLPQPMQFNWESYVYKLFDGDERAVVEHLSMPDVVSVRYHVFDGLLILKTLDSSGKPEYWGVSAVGLNGLRAV